MSDYRIIDTNADNISGCSLCGNKIPNNLGHRRKANWLKERYAEGLKYKVLRSEKFGDIGMIEYALGNLALNHVYAWTADDRNVSGTMQDYFANFIKTGNPNMPGLPEWPLFSSGQRLVIDLAPHLESTSLLRERYTILDSIPSPAGL